VTTGDGCTYEFRLGAQLDDHWSSSFVGLAVERHADGTCTLTGPVADQAQLHGVLAQLRDIGAPLLSLRTLDGDDGCRLSGPSAGRTRGRDVQRRGGC
jgi:hypothetical protein